jgi:hypothetical protein
MNPRGVDGLARHYLKGLKEAYILGVPFIVFLLGELID